MIIFHRFFFTRFLWLCQPCWPSIVSSLFLIFKLVHPLTLHKCSFVDFCTFIPKLALCIFLSFFLFLLIRSWLQYQMPALKVESEPSDSVRISDGARGGDWEGASRGGCFGDFLSVTVTPRDSEVWWDYASNLCLGTPQRGKKKTGKCCWEEGTSGILNLPTATGAWSQISGR